MSEETEDKEANEMSEVHQCKKAILHTLHTICDDHRKWYLLGYGTQTYELLTTAVSRLNGKSMAEVRKHFSPRHPAPPEPKGGRFICTDCKADFNLTFAAGMQPPTRCPFCGSHQIDRY